MRAPMNLNFNATTSDLLFLVKAMESAHRSALSLGGCYFSKDKVEPVFNVLIIVDSEGSSTVGVRISDNDVEESGTHEV